MTSNYLRVLTLLAITPVIVSVAKPPLPYTPVKASLLEFHSLNRTTRLGPMLLPMSVVAAGREILAAPIELLAEPADAFRLLPHTESRAVTDKSAGSADWKYNAESADFYIRTSMKGDYDGFCWYEIQLEPKHPVTLKS